MEPNIELEILLFGWKLSENSPNISLMFERSDNSADEAVLKKRSQNLALNRNINRERTCFDIYTLV